MRKYLSSIFGDGRRRPTPKPRLGVEELTPRVLPSAACSAAASGASTQAARFASGFSAADDSSSDEHGGHGWRGEHGAAHATFAAALSNSSGATGTASFNESAGSLFVSIKGAAASTTLNVAVTDNGTTTTVGTVTTDASGNGHAKLTGVTVAAGDTVTVGDLTGTFAQVKFTASLTGMTGVSGTASFNSVKNSLHVSVTGATASTTYDVTVDGTVIGQFTTNSNGHGRLKLSLSGVAIAAGSTISIADTAGDAAILTGTFA
jgi:hypothetical protein